MALLLIRPASPLGTTINLPLDWKVKGVRDVRIGELAARSGVTAKTVRFWESTGLLADPSRTPSGYREYPPEVVDRLEFIRHAQTAGLTLAEIRQVLTISDEGKPPCSHVTELIHLRLAELDDRIRELTATRRRLRHLAGRAAIQDPTECTGYCVLLRPEATTD